MSDIIERLDQTHAAAREGLVGPTPANVKILAEAAIEITFLRARVAELEGALEVWQAFYSLEKAALAPSLNDRGDG